MSLQSIIQQIKTATLPGENTALRVGSALEQMDAEKRNISDSLSASDTIDMINAVKLLATTDTPFLGTIDPSTVIPAGDFWAFAEEGTYTNAGGIVVSAGEIAIITRVGSTFDSVILDVPVRSIEDIAKTSTVGLVDTYTITYTDGSTPTTFEVTNGADGGGSVTATFEPTNDQDPQGGKQISDWVLGYTENIVGGIDLEQDLLAMDINLTSGQSIVYILKFSPEHTTTKIYDQIKLVGWQAGNIGIEKYALSGTTLNRTAVISQAIAIGENTIDLPVDLKTFESNEHLGIRINPTSLLGRIKGKTSSAPTGYTIGTFIGTATTFTDPATQNMRAAVQLISGAQTIEHSGSVQDVVRPYLGNLSDDLATNINLGGSVFLKPEIYTISSALSIPSNTTIRGVKGKTVIRYTGTGDLITLNATKENIIFKDIIFEGNTAITPVAMSIADIKALTGIGTQNAFNVTAYAKDIFIEGCVFKNFTGCGIKSSFTHTGTYNRTMKITKNVFFNNYMGMQLGTRSEYHQFSENTFAYNKIGAWVEGGNNYGCVNHFNANSVGLVVTGINANNDTHGSISTSSFNHNLSYSLFAFSVNVGYAFTGCLFFEGNIYIDDCRGLSIQGGTISAGIDTANEDVGYNIIANNIFTKITGGGTITGSPTKLALFGNRFIDGSSSVSINNSI